MSVSGAHGQMAGVIAVAATSFTDANTIDASPMIGAFARWGFTTAHVREHDIDLDPFAARQLDELIDRVHSLSASLDTGGDHFAERPLITTYPRLK